MTRLPTVDAVSSTGASAEPPERSLLRAARGLALSCHPFPSLAVTGLVAGMAALAGATPARGALVTIAILGGQLSIGWSNDALDAGRDRAVQRRDKPTAAGVISPRVTGIAAALGVVAAVAVSAPLGWRVCVITVAGVACGWAYNFGAKATALSWLPYGIAFGTLPAVATFASPAARWPAAWVTAAGFLLGVAAHLANVLPDLRADEATGIRGLPHRLGARASAAVGAVLLAASAVVVLLGSAGHVGLLTATGVAATIVVAVWATIAAWRNPSSRVYFFAVIVIAAIDLVSFAVSGAALD